MSTPKGYSSQEKDERLSAEFATVEPIRQLQHGLSTLAHVYMYSVGTDAAEASSTDSVINATAHAALVGDVINFTSGTFSGREVKVYAVDTNTITLAETLSASVGTGDTFEILRHKYPVVSSTGSLFTAPISSGPIQFTLDGATVTVTEDTVTPANNIPLPVQITSATGPINITAGDLNVQLTDVGVNADVTRIGDGTNRLDIVAEDAASVSGATGIVAMAVRNSAGAVMTSTDGDYSFITTDDTGAIRTVGTSESATVADGGALPAVVKVVAGYDGANVQVLHTDVAGDLQVDVLTSALPTGAATEATLASIDGKLNSLGQKTSANSVPVVIASDQSSIAVTATATDLDIRDLTHVSDSVKVGDGTDFLSITGAGEALVSLTTALPAGTNNIGDVDVLSQPARSHTTDSIRIGDGTELVNVTASNQLEVAVTAALPSGTNNIGDVDVLSEPATFAEDSAHTTGDLGKFVLAVRNDAGTALAGTTGDYIPITTNSSGALWTAVAGTVSVSSGGKTVATTVRNDYTSTNVTTGAWVELVASLGSTVNEIEIFDSSGQTLELGTGAAAAETRLILVFPGGNGRVPTLIASGTRVSIRAVSATANAGELDINFYN